MNEDDIGDVEMKQLQSVSNLENPFNQGFHLAQALPTCTKQETRHVQQTYNKKLKWKSVIYIAIEVCNAPCNNLCNIISSKSLSNGMSIT